MVEKMGECEELHFTLDHESGLSREPEVYFTSVIQR